MARRDLRRWAKAYAERDEIVLAAARYGVGVNEIARTTGVAKTTVIRILAAEGSLT